MKVLLTFEGHELYPPGLLEQCQQAIARTIQAHGWRPMIEVDQEAQLLAHVRYFEWLKENG